MKNCFNNEEKMTSKLSYIFKYKKKNEKKLEGKSFSSNSLSTLTFKKILMQHLNLSDEQCIIDDVGVIFSITINDIKSIFNGIKIIVHQSMRVIFMDITIDGFLARNIEMLECFDSVILDSKIVVSHFGKNMSIAEDYEIIKTFDAVSSYYCNLLYPKLDEFDRKMRLLLYNTYYLVYGSDFPYKFNYYCPNDTLKIRGKNSSGNEFCSDKIFYAYDYSQLINILFVHKRPALNGEEKTDWDLFFANKIRLEQSEQDIREIKQFRDKIAHCKIFTKRDYTRAALMLDKYCIALDSAIELTYSQDFLSEFISSLKAGLEVLTGRIEQILLETNDLN